MNREPRLGELTEETIIVLKPAPGGGWVVSKNPWDKGNDCIIGAFTDVHDMLAALSSALLPEDVGPTIEDRVADVLFPDQESGRLRRGDVAVDTPEANQRRALRFRSTRGEG